MYQQIAEIAEALRRLEPHSPIPYLLERCVKLGALPFPELMREVIREATTLDRMAVAHAADMACRDYFDHRNPEQQRLQDRLTRADDGSLAGWHRLAEVIGTSVTPRRQLDRWLDSRSHRRAVLEEEYDRVGVGLVRIAGSRYGTYWAVEFAADGR